MRLNAIGLSLLVVGLGMTACAASRSKVDFRPRGPESYPTKGASCEIEVLESGSEREYIDLGTLNYHDERHRLSDGELTLDTAISEMKKLACLNGADALMSVRVTENRRLEFAMFHVTAKAIRYAGN